MEVPVQGVYEQDARVDKLPFRPLQPCDGPVLQGIERTPEVT